MIQNLILENKSKVHSNFLDEDILNLADLTFRIPDEFGYDVIEVTDAFIARMDLISLQLYGNPNYSDFLCKLNGVSNPFELNTGERLVAPRMEDLLSFFGTEALKEESPSGKVLDTTPKAKGRQEKRGPNEAVIGDRRYKIDNTKKIIIY